MKLENLIGKRYGRLLVVKEEGKGYHKRIWLCKCDCGNYKTYSTSVLNSGTIKSCGCYKKDIAIKNFTKHNMYKTKIYYVYYGIKDRCYNKKAKAYKNYGDKGIKVCDEWLDGFINFYNWAIANGYKEGLTIDRIDSNGNYEPSNCRWVDRIIQNNNTNRNHYITYNGEAKTISEWARYLGMNRQTLQGRLRNGHSIKEAFEKPIEVKYRRNGG